MDLGLPSGTLWATCNIGANSPEEAGLYFAWGETQGYTSGQVGTVKNFIWTDYEFAVSSALTKYNETDGLTVLEDEDDAATVNWGTDWRMPTKAEFDELEANTDFEWKTVNGVKGAKFTSKVDGYTDKFLFLPAVGDVNEGIIRDFRACYYWTSCLADGYSVAWCVQTMEAIGKIDNYQWFRCNGLSVRPVRK